MTFLSNIANKKHLLTKSELRAYDKILEDLTRVQMLSLTKISEEINISKTTILRFCQKLGYGGYTEFRYACIRYVNSLSEAEEKENSTNLKIEAIQKSYIQTIEQMSRVIHDSEMKMIATKISKARIIRCIGEVNSSVTCLQLRYALAMYGYNVDVITNSADVTSIDLVTTQEDLVILITAGANMKSHLINETVRLVDNCSCEFVVVTMNDQTELAQIADNTIFLPNVVTLKSNSILENVPIFSIFVEILLSYL